MDNDKNKSYHAVNIAVKDVSTFITKSEERIRREKIERRIKLKEQHQTKVNEERVKDNLRKTRIEKLTQEEIHQQRDDKSYKQNNQMSKSKDDDNKIGEESLHDVRVLSDTSTLPHQSKSKQLNDNQSKENQYHNKVIESSENKSIKRA